ncbi:hypothetical protein BDB00DRAFT_777303 [Zychaea mexicana]|uniref:uncharacterized protein n=1 Tax=Zychaea mexicana TaxID=64656 RepID=UPI0022FF0543|nr:uncharacterized protein BDB00DRAFT_777303 [Zychaea mexicana]KAI9468661.1 hypothetical protein BDB00DRAFT_777303 [Zychaea mexicana]
MTTRYQSGGLPTNSSDAYKPLLDHPSQQFSAAPYYKKKSSTRLGLIAAALTVFGVTSIYLGSQLPNNDEYSTFVTSVNAQGLWGGEGGSVIAPGISYTSFQYGLSKCQQHDVDQQQQQSTSSNKSSDSGSSLPRQRNPRGPSNSKLLIKNGHIWLGDRYLDGDILIQDGLIIKVQHGLEVPEDDENVRVIDAAGRVVSPGIVDMHTHATAASFPGLDALADENEMTHPTTPYVRVIDAINPSDPAIKIISSGGVTTSLVLPGSGNLMGGEAAVIKLRPVPTLSNQDMLITAGVDEEQDNEKIWRYMKMACGENPKSWYGAVFNRMPMTRMGEAYLFRHRFEEAQNLKRKQDDWCDAAQRINKTLDDISDQDRMTRLSERYPESLKLESLVALLRHQVKLNVHCYLPQDLEAMVQHSLEFDFEIAAFHHALSAWQVPEVLKRAKTNITVATFADMWGYKQEAMDQNVNAPNILSEAGIPVAFKSDHPVMNARDLLHEAQKAYHYGFNEHKALAALTSVPANALGLGHRVGSIEPGKDADIVIWERHPLRLGARPKQVIVDGIELDYQTSWTKHVDEMMEDKQDGDKSTLEEEDKVLEEKEDPEMRHWLPVPSSGTMKLEDHGMDNPVILEEACSPNTDSFVLRNISRLYMGPEQTYSGSVYLVVKDGQVACAGDECDRDHIEWPSSSPVFEMGGAVVIPGLVSSGISLGLGEIQAEPTTLDGYAENDVADPDLAQKIARAVDGLKLDSLHLQKAFKAGVTTSVSQPLVDSSLLAGVTVAFRTGVKNTFLDANDTFIKEEAALHFAISHAGKLTVSQQIAAIRELLSSPPGDNNGIFARAAQGLIPVVVEANDKDEIASIVQLKRQLVSKGSIQFIILGGAESYLVADHLAVMDIPVILKPARCFPGTWQERLCLAGPPMTPETALDILVRRGVRVGLASTDMEDGNARNLIWEAGWNLAHNHQLSVEDAIGLVTWNVAEMFNLDRPENPDPVGVLRHGRKADFVVYNGDPFVFGTQVLMVYGGGHAGPLCFPKQI